jgi:hypothetical protein
MGACDVLLIQGCQKLAHGWFTDRFQRDTSDQEDSLAATLVAAFFVKIQANSNCLI